MNRRDGSIFTQVPTVRESDVTSNAMQDYELKNIEPDDIDDILVKVENVFDIKFVGDELFHITNFGQLCDHIANKIQLVNTDDCTSQQAFYKLRDAITSTLQIDNDKVSPNTSLKDLIPRRIRRSRTKRLEQTLGFALNILRPPHWLVGALSILVLASVVGLFIRWQFGLSGLAFSIAGLWFAYKLGKEFDLETIGQVAEKMTYENYLKSRRNPTTINRNEIEKVLTELFSDYFDIDKSKLTRDASFV